MSVCYANEALPVQLVWVSSMFILLGGGQRVFKSMIFTIVADTVDQSHRQAQILRLSYKSFAELDLVHDICIFSRQYHIR